MAMTKRTLDEILDEISDDLDYVEWEQQRDEESRLSMDEDGEPWDFNNRVHEIIGHRQYWSV